MDLVDFAKEGKKKKKKKKAKKESAAVSNLESADSTKVNLNIREGHTNFTYDFLLDRIEEQHLKKLEAKDEDEVAEKLEMPKTNYISLRTNWSNFEAIRQKIDRPAFHVLDFFKTELDVEGVIHPDGNIILSGKYQNKNITALFK